jgi:hypothetical protein
MTSHSITLNFKSEEEASLFLTKYRDDINNLSVPVLEPVSASLILNFDDFDGLEIFIHKQADCDKVKTILYELYNAYRTMTKYGMPHDLIFTPKTIVDKVLEYEQYSPDKKIKEYLENNPDSAELFVTIASYIQDNFAEYIREEFHKICADNEIDPVG